MKRRNAGANPYEDGAGMDRRPSDFLKIRRVAGAQEECRSEFSSQGKTSVFYPAFRLFIETATSLS
jgi:hypothetical protein